MTNSDKIYRALKFISGARVVTIYKQLEEGGFTKAALVEGARLLHTAAILTRGPRHGRSDEATLVERCEEFQRRWFRPVRAALGRSYPTIAEEFFKDFTVETGTRAVLSVRVFLDRLETLAKGEAPFGEDGPKARQFLNERMLTEEVESEGLALVSELSNVSELREGTGSAVQAEAAVAELWAWYLDWSGTARTIVTSKSSLRALGYGRSRANGDEIDGEFDDEDDEPTVTTTPATGPGAPTPALVASPPIPASAVASGTALPGSAPNSAAE